MILDRFRVHADFIGFICLLVSIPTNYVESLSGQTKKQFHLCELYIYLYMYMYVDI